MATAKGNTEDCILEFKGGLGNQMFQYAFYLGLVKNGVSVKCMITNNQSRPFMLNIFPNVHFDEADKEEYTKRVERYANRGFFSKGINKAFPFTKDVFIEDEDKEVKKWLFAHKGKVISGYFQNIKYIRPVEEEIRKAFHFPNGEKKLEDYADQIRGQGYVGVHIRRGDYLQLSDIYGNICDDRYYDTAMDYFEEKGINKFVFFGNDMEWIKNKYQRSNMTFFEGNGFDLYQDWYDMYIMSCCDHNIIANSSFSWWGAWLNNNLGKVIIAPKKWINTKKMKNVCPSEWIRL